MCACGRIAVYVLFLSWSIIIFIPFEVKKAQKVFTSACLIPRYLSPEKYQIFSQNLVILLFKKSASTLNLFPCKYNLLHFKFKINQQMCGRFITIFFNFKCKTNQQIALYFLAPVFCNQEVLIEFTFATLKLCVQVVVLSMWST